MRLKTFLAEKKSNIIKKWRDLVVATYPGDAQRFLRKEKNRFANPVGRTISEAVETLYDELLKGGIRKPCLLPLTESFESGPFRI